MSRKIEFSILGPLEVRRDGQPVALAAGRQRALLLLLLLNANDVVSSDALIDQLWHPSPPPTARASLQNLVSRLRKQLGEDVIETVPPGYRANVERELLDVTRVESLIGAAHQVNAAERASLLEQALALWRGLPLVEFPAEPFAQAEIGRLEELRLFALEERIDAELELGRHARLVPELESLVEQQPLRERLWQQLMFALYRSGRQAEALATYRRAHQVFVEELGIEPGHALRELQRAILIQDSRLADGVAPADVLTRAASLLPTKSYAERATSLLEYSVALWRLGEHDHATRILERATTEAQRSGDTGVVELVRVALTAQRRARGQVRERDYLDAAEQAVAAAADADDRTRAKLLCELGMALRATGRAEDSAAAFEQSIELARLAHDPWQEGWSRNMLGISWAIGPVPASQVLERLEQQLDALEWGPPGPIGLWASLGLVNAQLGDASAARTFATRAIEAAREGGLQVELAVMHEFAAASLETLGDAAAEAHLVRAADLLAAAESAPRSGVQAALARYALQRGEVERAEALLESAAASLRDDAPGERVGYGCAAALLALAHDLQERARGLAHAAVETAMRTDFPDLQGGALEALAAIDPSSDAHTRALAVYERKGNAAALARLGR